MGKHSASGRGSSSRRRSDHSRAGISIKPRTPSTESRRDHRRRIAHPDVLERARAARRRKHIALGCGLTLLIAIVAFAVYGSVWVGALNKRMTNEAAITPEVTEALEVEEPERPDDPFYMLVMGIDAREEGEDARSDTLIVVRVDPPQQQVTMLSIPRDTRVEVPGHGKTKINAAHAYGGPALAIETVREFTGLPISHYMEIDFNGFKEIVDAMGGVTVTVPERIHDMKAADHNASAATLKAGEQELTGAQALTFARSRQFPTGDFQRIANQQTLVKAMLRQSLQVGNALRLPKILDAVANNVTTDLSITDLYKIANDMKSMSDDDLMTATMPGEARMIGGGSYVIPDEAAFAVILDRISQGLPPVPGEEEATTELLPADIVVTVRNGAGIEGVAADAAARLTSAGFTVGEVGNANQFVYDETLIVYADDSAGATLVQQKLGAGRVVESRGMYSFSTDVLLVVGKDWQIGGTQN